MQNSQPYPTSPPQHQGARIAPRRTRRGALMPAAVLAVLVITILMSQFAQAQLQRASAARSEARAVQLAAIAADFDYYVHENRNDLATDLAQLGLRGQELPSVDVNLFETEFLRVGVAREISSFELDYLISLGADGKDVFGALRLSASGARGRADICALIARLARHGAEYQGVPDAGTAGTCDTNISEYLIQTAPLSGVNPAYVLRARRAGHPAPKLVGGGALDLGGNNLTVRNLTATGGEGSRAKNRVAGTLRTREMTGTLTSLRRNPDLDEPDKTGNVEIAGTTAISGAFKINGLLDAGTLTSSGNLNIGGIILIQDWVKTNTLTTAKVGPISHLATLSMTLGGTATINGPLTTETLQSPAVTVSGEFTARQLFTKEAEVGDLDIRGECHGC